MPPPTAAAATERSSFQRSRPPEGGRPGAPRIRATASVRAAAGSGGRYGALKLSTKQAARGRPVGPNRPRATASGRAAADSGGRYGALKLLTKQAARRRPSRPTPHARHSECACRRRQRRPLRSAQAPNEAGRPKAACEVGHTGLEPVTSCVSCKRASQLRQWPMTEIRIGSEGRRIAEPSPGGKAR